MAQGDIVIRIKKGGDGGNTAINKETGTTKQTYPSIEKMETRNYISQTVFRNAYEYAKNISIDSAEYFINRHFQLTDDYIGQRNMNITLNAINRGAQLGRAVWAGAIAGGIVGAVVAGVGNVAVQGFGVYKSLDQQNIRIVQLNDQLSFTRERSGYSLTSGSIGDNK